MEANSVNFSPKRKIVKFSQTFEVMQSDSEHLRVVYQKAVNPAYSKFYEKLESIIDAYFKSGSVNDLSFVVTFADENYISGLFKSKAFLVPLNFDVSKGLFQNDSQVLKKIHANKREVIKRVKKFSKTSFVSRPFVYLIDKGVGICIKNESGEWGSVKIRQ